MWNHETQIRVRYGETDKMGYLYYGHYAEYLEVARVEMIRSIGLTYKDLEDIHKVIMPVMSMEVHYYRPAYYDDLLTVKTVLTELPVKDFKYEFEIFNEKNELLTKAKVKLCFVDSMTMKRIHTPEFLIEAVQQFFHEQ